MLGGAAELSTTGLKVARTRVRNLARERGLDGMFAVELSAMERRVALAVRYDSLRIAEVVAGEVGALARQLAVTSQAVRRLGTSGRVRAAERPSTLSLRACGPLVESTRQASPAGAGF